MSKIRLLPQEVIDQIAAGQVVDRPASVVKELIDNALDAGASHIQIRIKNGGMDEITVIDDGRGMSKSDIEQAWQKHTTSKITSLDDLGNISSYGFRGEALASIGVVSELTIASKQSSSTSGWQKRIDHGKQHDIEPVGMPDGTRITVAQLFRDIPVRKKFMKSLRAEVKNCMRVIIAYSLAVPEVHFSVQINGSERLSTQKFSTYQDRLAGISHRDFSQSIPVDSQEDVLRVSGFIGKPQVQKSSDAYMFVHVNNRPVQNPTLKKALKRAYGTLIEARGFPILSVNIEYPPERVDVNVDPHKDTIKLHGEKDFIAAVQKAVSDALHEYDLTYASYNSNMDPELAKELRKTTPWNVQNIADTDIAQFLNTYIMFQDGDEVVIVDQHAAHERILFEQYQKELQSKKSKTHLKKSVVVSLPAQYVTLMEEHAETLDKMGFGIEEFGDSEYKIESVPSYLQHRDVEEGLHQVLDQLAEDDEFDSLTYKTLTYVACRSAIKAGDILGPTERKELIEKLKTCKDPFTCPHGRPTTIRMHQSKLDAMFKR